MIPAAFEYYRPTDMAGVIALLQEHGDDARVIAGGHSLIPMMKLRMAEVPHLIDLQDIDGLEGISVADGVVQIGANAEIDLNISGLRKPIVSAPCPPIE